ncbi:MAG: hypothetical protein R2716_09675 [Microthrixaceae bacterium]
MFAARPVAIAVSFMGSHLPRREWAAAAWFGPKGFASVVYGLLIVRIGTAAGDEIFHLIAIVVVMSILVHSSSDVPVAHWFERAQGPVAHPGHPEGPGPDPATEELEPQPGAVPRDARDR